MRSVCFVHVCVRATIHFVLTKQWFTVVAMKAVVDVCMQEGTSFDMGHEIPQVPSPSPTRFISPCSFLTILFPFLLTLSSFGVLPFADYAVVCVLLIVVLFVFMFCCCRKIVADTWANLSSIPFRSGKSFPMPHTHKLCT